MRSHSIMLLLTTCVCLAAIVSLRPAIADPKKESNTRSSVAAIGASQQSRAGRVLFKTYDCSACHIAEGKGCSVGISLDGIGKRRSKQFILEQLLDPEGHVAKHAKEFGNNPDLMPNARFSKEQAEALVSYLVSLPPSIGRGKKAKTGH